MHAYRMLMLIQIAQMFVVAHILLHVPFGKLT